MTSVSLPTNSITRSQYEARQGLPMQRTYALLSQSCPSCGQHMNANGYADWVKDHGIIVTLWHCVTATSTCEASRLTTSFRLETSVETEE